MPIENTSQSNYVRNIEVIDSYISREVLRLHNLQEKLRKEGNSALSEHLRGSVIALQDTRALLKSTVIAERQRLVEFLKAAPMAQSQDLESPRPVYPSVFVEKPPRTLPNE